MAILLWVLSIASVGTLVYWSVVLYHLVRTVRRLPPASAGVELADADPGGDEQRVCVVVPAHNERGSIAELIRSLKVQDHPHLSVVLCIDRSTDDTESVAAEAIDGDTRFQIVRVDECPDGWAGKVHAVWTGVSTARSARQADLLLFADADTVFDPACVRATVALLRDRELALLSLLSTLTCRRWFEWMVQPIAALELVHQYPLIRANRDRGRRAFANGQFMLFTKQAYERIGGHASVRTELLEDIALARRIEAAGLRGGVLLADGMLRCRMYESWSQFRRGWKRIYTEAAKRRPDRLRRSARRVRLLGCLLPIASLTCAIVGGVSLRAYGHSWTAQTAMILGVLAVGLWILVTVRCLRLSHAPIWAVPSSVIGSWMVGTLLHAAARDLERGRPTTWAGRSYVRESRTAGSALEQGTTIHDPGAAIGSGP